MVDNILSKRGAKLLLVLVAVILILRLVAAFSFDGLTYQSYFHLRMIDNIVENGYPRFIDDYSYGGREIRFLPLYHYLVALPSFFMETPTAARIVTNILYSLIPIMIFFIARSISHDEESSIVAALISAILPILFVPNTAGTESLFFVLVLICIYVFMMCEKKNYLYYYGMFFLLLNFTSSLAALLLVGFVVYLLLAAVEGRRVKREQVELIIFSFFFYVWLQLILFKDHFLAKGISFVFQNVPSEAVYSYFPSVSISSAILLIGVIPFLAGIYVVYHSLFELKMRPLILLISLVISTTVLAWLRLVPFNVSLAFFALVLSVLFGLFYRDLIIFLRKTKIAQHESAIRAAILIIIVASMIPLSISSILSQDIPPAEELRAFSWLSSNTEPGSGVLAMIEEGHLVSYAGRRANVMDEEFMLADNVNERFSDVQTMYTTRFQSSALELLEKYNVKYIMLTPRARNYYEIYDLPYKTPECFERVYKENTTIYKVNCLLRSQ